MTFHRYVALGDSFTEGVGDPDPARPNGLRGWADRVADVLACKPSELAFYPVPKLMIRRVGDHEAYSAVRASELGDGTFEARELGEALDYLALFAAEGADLVRAMNDAIVRNGSIGVYDGCKVAVETAASL